MKHLCYNKYILLFFLFFATSLFASLSDKSAIVYYGKHISYTMVGIHDYIIVDASKINVYAHGYDVYKNKMYVRIPLQDSPEKLLESVDAKVSQGYKNFYFDKGENKSIDIDKFLKQIKSKYPKSKLILNTHYKLPLNSYELLQAVVVDNDAVVTKQFIENLHALGVDIIKLKFTSFHQTPDEIQKFVEGIKTRGMIPYVSNFELKNYGTSSKNAIKREIFTLIDESKDDRTLLGAHQVGAMPMEYLGYIQKLYDISKGLPDISQMMHYAGVVVWLRGEYKHPGKLINWVLALHKKGIKTAFVNNFGFAADATLIKPLDIDIYDGDESTSNKKRIVYKDPMMGFEVEPSLGDSGIYMHPNDARPLLVYEDDKGKQTITAAITKWGGYAISEAFLIEIDGENEWVVNPFKFFVQALRLKKLIVPDPTTENGNRLFFSHIDGDGIMNLVESNPELYSGNVILDKILRVYKTPISVSVIGAEISPKGLYPKISDKLMDIAAKMFALDNVEPASHTFTHPFFWGKIKNGNLSEKYRLKPKGYTFSLHNELEGPLEFIQKRLHPLRPAKTVFWSGDCAPRLNALDYVYKHKILNINGGDTTINNTAPWLTLVAPLGLERGDYYQIYTGEQNENVFTNDWLGPFWGFKRVVQTFKLTNSPRRLKPIDIYYHQYSGSKTASTNALKYVYEWAMKQDVMPIFTSEYIPKVMDYYTLSMANEGNEWLFDGMKSLKTVRIENPKSNIDLKKSKTALGFCDFENHRYISFDKHDENKLLLCDKNQNDANYLIASNAKVSEYINGVKNKRYIFDGHVPLQLEFHLQKNCSLKSEPKASNIIRDAYRLKVKYVKSKKARVDVVCRP